MRWRQQKYVDVKTQQPEIRTARNKYTESKRLRLPAQGEVESQKGMRSYIYVCSLAVGVIVLSAHFSLVVIALITINLSCMPRSLLTSV
jgi:hypothetical protein